MNCDKIKFVFCLELFCMAGERPEREDELGYKDTESTAVSLAWRTCGACDANLKQIRGGNSARQRGAGG